MGIISKLFSKKVEEKEVKPQKAQVDETKSKKYPKDAEGYYICDHCDFHIIPELHGIRTAYGAKFHKKCLRKVIKEGKKQAFS